MPCLGSVSSGRTRMDGMAISEPALHAIWTASPRPARPAPRHDTARHGTQLHGAAHYTARTPLHGKSPQHPTRPGRSARRNTTQHGTVRYGTARLGSARHGTTRHGSAECVTARHGKPCVRAARRRSRSSVETRRASACRAATDGRRGPRRRRRLGGSTHPPRPRPHPAMMCPAQPCYLLRSDTPRCDPALTRSDVLVHI